MLSDSLPSEQTTESESDSGIRDSRDPCVTLGSPLFADEGAEDPQPPSSLGSANCCCMDCLPNQATPGTPPATSVTPATIRRIDQRFENDPRLCYSVLRPTAPPTDMLSRPVFVLVHGLEHCGDCWLPTAMLLVERGGFTVILVNLRSHGESLWTCPVSQATFGQYISDVERILNDYQQVVARSLQPNFLLVGHSMGGPIAELVARRRTVAGLYLLATVTPALFFASVWRSLAGLFWRYLLFHPRRLLAILSGRSRVFDTANVIRRYLLGQDATDEQVHALHQQLWPESVRAIRGILVQGVHDRSRLLLHRSYLRSASRARLIRVAAAGDDALMPSAMAARAARFLNAEFHVLSGLPHDAMCARANAISLNGEALAMDLTQFADHIANAGNVGVAENVGASV